ncbi:MAG: hypothetical protein ABFR31_06470 [Thermodesulfobacteriota bacterium]
MMTSLFNKNSDCVAIECPLCRTKKSIKKSDVNNSERISVIRCKCTCGCSFQKRLEKKDPREMDIISAIAQLDFGVLWFKIQHPLAFLNR